MTITKAKARSCASIANLAAGFDCLGLAFSSLHDEVIAHRETQAGCRLGVVSGCVQRLPVAPLRNTALRAGLAVLRRAGADFGVSLDIAKGIPLSAGLGGSAASAVAGALAVNALLATPLDKADLFACALEGEAASSDPPPYDNVAAALYGGLVLIDAHDPVHVSALPVPDGIVCLVFHPDLRVDTRAARALLADTVPLSAAVAQMRHLAGFIAGCYANDSAQISRAMRDLVIEPQRAALVPPFYDVQRAAFDAGALGCSLSGSGPSIFAWATDERADAVQTAMAEAFEMVGMAARHFGEKPGGGAAQVIPS